MERPEFPLGWAFTERVRPHIRGESDPIKFRQMNKPKIDNGPVAQLDCKTRKGIQVIWSPARVREIQIQKSSIRNRMLKALGLAVSMTAAVMISGIVTG
jgi:hypothetical protein